MFSILDLQSVYQVLLHEESRDLSAFITHDGLLRYCHMPYGLANASSAFQQMMSQMLAGQEGIQCDLDIAIYGLFREKHECPQSVLHHNDQVGLKLNYDKCHFRKTELSVSGLCIFRT